MCSVGGLDPLEVSMIDKLVTCAMYGVDIIVADRKHDSTYSPVAFRSVHTGIEPPFLLKIYYAITACMTQGFTSRKYRLKEK